MQNEHYTIKELPESERPYEKCRKFGPKFLSDAELLAVIIRVGSKKERCVELAHKVLNLSKNYNGLVGLNYISMEQLMGIHGIGTVKATQLICISELAKRMNQMERKSVLSFRHPRLVAEYYMPEMRFLEKENLVLILLDTKSNLIKDLVISTGTVNMTISDPREIFVCAFQYHAVQIILLHNHPSGDPTPSKEDIITTKRIKEAGILLGIQLIDHIIIGDNQYVSMREKELI
ncbi:RadC family protein [Anaeromicropila populeti]|uniref:DNA replication and repair protein RadC n=1 Tax=Anaeromicropila populeti TaxID=37658 RepID=A0A1I6L7R8_9FIRM|nr:DNA repair protein RadC [Anaeromicropila populeti]SFR99516.1 DNA replication and repair protein RadC [Anaeromicropila populeti]